MDEKNELHTNEPALKEWETPELVIEDVKRVTQGGPETSTTPIDGEFYAS